MRLLWYLHCYATDDVWGVRETDIACWLVLSNWSTSLQMYREHSWGVACAKKSLVFPLHRFWWQTGPRLVECWWIMWVSGTPLRWDDPVLFFVEQCSDINISESFPCGYFSVRFFSAAFRYETFHFHTEISVVMAVQLGRYSLGFIVYRCLVGLSPWTLNGAPTCWGHFRGHVFLFRVSGPACDV